MTLYEGIPKSAKPRPVATGLVVNFHFTTEESYRPPAIVNGPDKGETNDRVSARSAGMEKSVPTGLHVRLLRHGKEVEPPPSTNGNSASTRSLNRLER